MYGILSFGGYIYTTTNIDIEYRISYIYNNKSIKEVFVESNAIEQNDWNNTGFHKEIEIQESDCNLVDIKIEMIISSTKNKPLEFVGFDFDVINKEELKSETFDVSFHQKTGMHIPYLFYTLADLPINKYLISDQKFEKGRIVVLKSCNRCGRYLPINIFNEVNTLAFSLHCKKRAPCVHSTFRAYSIMNNYDISKLIRAGIKVENNKVISYYGHQLECKACKKFFVNMPLNPQRNAQQFKEDGLRRRALEVLVDSLLNKNLIHFEYKQKTKKEFAEYIWKKFDKRCFKCKKKLTLSEMNLDHTMPLAYLYRLDETATCLCDSHNSQKSDNFPVDYYSEEELKELSKKTGLDLRFLHTRSINLEALELLIKNIIWFYDEFLMNPDYQKVRDGILTADKINDSLKRVIQGRFDLAEEYKKIKGRYPKSITIIKK